MTHAEQELADTLDLIAADRRIAQFKGTADEDWAYQMALHVAAPRLNGALLAVLKERVEG